MKKTLKLIGIVAIVAIIGFAIVACDDNDDNGVPELINTVWKCNVQHSIHGEITSTLTFTTETAVTYNTTFSGGETEEGTYIVNGKALTATFETWTLKGTFSGNKLTDGDGGIWEKQ